MNEFSLLHNNNYSFGHICGIDKQFINNYEEYKQKNLLEEIICPICLKILLDPLECNKCQVLICNNCHFILECAGKNCIKENCKGIYIKSNKYAQELLRGLIIKCYGCNKDNINYNDFLKHIETCEDYLANPALKKLIIIKKRSEEIKNLKEEKENLIEEAKKKYVLSDQELRERYLTNELESKDKVSFYQSVVEKNVDTYQRYVLGTYGKKYNIFELVSPPEYGWTTFHYAMHYAVWEIIKFIIEHLQSENKIEVGFNLKTKDNKCPLLCLLKSKAIKPDVKRDVFDKIITNFNIPVSNEVINELKNIGFTDLISKIKPYHMKYNFLI